MSTQSTFITNDANKVLKERLSELIGFSKALKFLIGFFIEHCPVTVMVVVSVRVKAIALIAVTAYGMFGVVQHCGSPPC